MPKLPSRLSNEEGNWAERERVIPPSGTRPRRYGLSYREFKVRASSRPIEHVIEPWLPVGGLATVVGDRGVGKTSFVLSLVDAIAKGGDFLGFAVPRPRSVLYVDGEMDPFELQQRLRAIRAASGRDGNGEPDLGNTNLWVLTHADQEEGIPDLADPGGPGRDWMTEALGDREVLVLDHLTVLDPNGNGDHLGNWDVMQWLLELRRRRKIVLIVDDTGETNRPVLNTIIRLWRRKPSGLVNVEFAKAKGCIKPDPFAAWMQCEDGYFRLHREGVTSRERRPDRIRLLD